MTNIPVCPLHPATASFEQYSSALATARIAATTKIIFILKTIFDVCEWKLRKTNILNIVDYFKYRLFCLE